MSHPAGPAWAISQSTTAGPAISAAEKPTLKKAMYRPCAASGDMAKVISQEDAEWSSSP